MPARAWTGPRTAAADPLGKPRRRDTAVASRRSGLTAFVVALAVMAACGGDSDGPTGGGGGGAGAGPAGAGGAFADAGVDGPAAGAGGGTTPVPAECAVATPGRQPPFTVSFRLHNGSGNVVFLRRGCLGPEFGVSSCAAGFRDDVAVGIVCPVCGCDEPRCNPAVCGPCPEPSGITVAPGATVTIDWTAVAHDFATRNGEQCVRDRTLPAARYRFAVRAYGSIVDASANRAGRSVTKDFTLPATGDAVDVELAGDASPACDADPSEPAPACTATQAREQACGLGEPLSFAWEGGLAFSYDEVRLEPAARYVRTRHYTMSQAQQPSLSCAVAVPRCSRDSRVATTGDVARAMALPDVAAAFGPDAPLFGENARAHDGAVLVVRRADGKSVAIGPDCHSDPNVGLCGKPLTDGLRELERVLVTLDAQGLPDPACANFR